MRRRYRETRERLFSFGDLLSRGDEGNGVGRWRDVDKDTWAGEETRRHEGRLRVGRGTCKRSRRKRDRPCSEVLGRVREDLEVKGGVIT